MGGDKYGSITTDESVTLIGGHQLVKPTGVWVNLRVPINQTIDKKLNKLKELLKCDFQIYDNEHEGDDDDVVVYAYFDLEQCTE